MAGESADNYVQANSPGVAADGGAIYLKDDQLDVDGAIFLSNEAHGGDATKQGATGGYASGGAL